jgi:hypothetical protein
MLEEINEEVRQGYPLSPIVLNICIEEAIEKRQKNLNQNILKLTLKLTTVLLADDQVIITENQENLQKAAYRLIKIVKSSPS